MTVVQSAALRGGISIVCGLASVISWRMAPRLRLSSQSFLRLFVAAFAVSRLGLFALAYLVLRLVPRGDIVLYMQEAVPALAGRLVYRDFITPHAPLDPYLLSSMLQIHMSPLSIMCGGILFDILAMVLWMKAAQYFLSTITLRRAALLVLFNPTSLLTEAIDGQMNSFIALFLALAVYLLVRHRNLLSGVAVAIPAATIKFITLIFAPGFLFAAAGARAKAVATAGFVGLLVLVYGAFSLAGADIRVPLTAEGTHLTSANLVYLVEMTTGATLGFRLPDVVLGLSWLTVVALTFFCMRTVSAPTVENRRRVFAMLTVSLLAELLCIQVFSKNTWDRYLVMAMFPLCVIAAELSFREMIGFGVWAASTCFEPSYWAGFLSLPTSQIAHRYLLAHDRHMWLLLVLECVVVFGDLFLLLSCARALVRLRKPETSPEGIVLPDTLSLSLEPALPGASA